MLLPSAKRITDIVVSLTLLLLLAPIIVVIYCLTAWRLGIPVIFVQQRPGYKAEPFIIFKFRTMRNAYDDKGHLLPDEKRLTNFGKWLRKSSLDELPELWNVLKGDMSLVGPRPLLMEYLPLYNEKQKRRHDVKPGITGWAQINGRNSLSWEEKFDMDSWYVDNRTFILDIKILLITIKKVFLREGINAEGHVTMDVFNGSN